MAKLAQSSPVMQMSWLTNDIDHGIDYWTKVMGVGPFLVIPDIRLEDCRFLGEPTDSAFTVALAYSGDMQIELVKRCNDAPGIYSGSYVRDVDYLHHLCVLSDDIAATECDIIARGGKILVEGSMGGRRVIYCDTGVPDQPLLEVFDPNTEQKGFFELIRQAGLDWDGQTQIMTL
jgi:methylmalonyl-CoA/ethylmalonyl-CoA epimerase